MYHAPGRPGPAEPREGHRGTGRFIESPRRKSRCRRHRHGASSTTGTTNNTTTNLFGTTTTTPATTTPTTSTSSTTTTVSFATSFDANRDLHLFCYVIASPGSCAQSATGTTTGTATGAILSANPTATDLSTTGGITGTLTLTSLTNINSVSDRVAIQASAESLSADGTHHVIVASAPVQTDGTFTIYPLHRIHRRPRCMTS